mmetsp:Transcript_18294/g.25352  ORF Transcript_18294/g.25352 Transcript_18294/m.25352 type:complete len:208 (+) Transcript_18294:386-1009(+)
MPPEAQPGLHGPESAVHLHEGEEPQKHLEEEGEVEAPPLGVQDRSRGLRRRRAPEGVSERAQQGKGESSSEAGHHDIGRRGDARGIRAEGVSPPFVAFRPPSRRSAHCSRLGDEVAEPEYAVACGWPSRRSWRSPQYTRKKGARSGTARRGPRQCRSWEPSPPRRRSKRRAAHGKRWTEHGPTSGAGGSRFGPSWRSIRNGLSPRRT